MACSLLAKSPFLGAGLAARRAATRAGVVRAPVVCRAERKTWYPGATPPSYLDGSMPGDRGFDPLRLASDPETRKWFQIAEIYNGQWAMAAVAGILFTDLIGKPKWWLAGAEPTFIDFKILVAVEIALFAVLETKRIQGWKKTGGSGVLTFFPFDPLGMASPETAEKEVKNGRLAMLAFLGFASQAAVRGLGPIDSLKLHIEDPWHNNIFTSEVGPESTLAAILLAIWPITIEGIKSVDPNKDSKTFFPWDEPWQRT